MKFGVGQPVRRVEDARFVTGAGAYTGDHQPAGMAHAVVVRSPHAHARFRLGDVEAVRAMPGVVLVLTHAEVADLGGLPCLVPIKNRDGTAMPMPPYPVLCRDIVRHVGDAVAFVVAETVQQAKDAAEAVMPDIEALPAVLTAEEAVKPGAPLLYDEAPGNVILDFKFGDHAAVEAAFARAAHVTRMRIVNSRIVVSAMEPRAALAEWDGEDGRYILRLGCQGVFGNRANLSRVMGVAPEKLRILTGN
ncbi:MAG TPA: molybdopterin cofactor-binding domain-containing protein, partial [Salinarimonas sp.]|nr:molybdopterin cofactor-binding domain-containing protein [Salinarimonas sp.]